jgi:hypothetical protein
MPPPARPPVRVPLGAVAALAAALHALPGCGENPLDPASKVPSGGPPPAGFATEILSAQNAVRADPNLANTAVGTNPQPAPSPALAPLSWSAEVASRAQAYADGCVFAHDERALHALGYGENLAATAPPGAYGATDVVQRAEMWAGEAQFYDYASNTCPTGQQCGHYTQLVWRGSTVVGCGVQTCTTNSPLGASFPTWQLWVCDYAPPGNWVGERPY